MDDEASANDSEFDDIPNKRKSTARQMSMRWHDE